LVLLYFFLLFYYEEFKNFLDSLAHFDRVAFIFLFL